MSSQQSAEAKFVRLFACLAFNCSAPFALLCNFPGYVRYHGSKQQWAHVARCNSRICQDCHLVAFWSLTVLLWATPFCNNAASDSSQIGAYKHAMRWFHTHIHLHTCTLTLHVPLLHSSRRRCLCLCALYSGEIENVAMPVQLSRKDVSCAMSCCASCWTWLKLPFYMFIVK